MSKNPSNTQDFSEQGNLIADIRIRWYDDTLLNRVQGRQSIRFFLECLGVTADVACDIFEVLVEAYRDGSAVSVSQIKEEVIKKIEKRGDENKGTTERNIQIWIKFFRDIEMIQMIGSGKSAKYMLYGGRKPSEVFITHTKAQVIDRASMFIVRALEKVEREYDI